MAQRLCSVLVCCIVLTHVLPAWAGQQYSGFGTYSGEDGNWACSGKRSAAADVPHVAINAVQFGGGSACGKCIVVTGTGTGAGKTPITGTKVYTIDNILTQGQSGDLDFPTGGDGRWGIEWEFVSCPSSSS